MRTPNIIFRGRKTIAPVVDVPGRQVIDPTVVKRGEAIRVNDEALKDLIIHLAPDTVFDLANYVRNPADPGGGVVTPVILLSYLVPSALILKINKIGITYSNPIVPMSQCVGWRVTINGTRVPNIVNTTDDYFYSSFGQVHSPLEIEPLWVQSNQVIAIEVYPRFGFNQQLTISGRLSGQIYKPATARLIESGV